MTNTRTSPEAMRTIAVGAVHGNEVIGARVINELLRNPITGVDWVIANPEALAQRKRYIDQNLAIAFIDKVDPSSYESLRAEEVVELCAPYDFIVDIHDTDVDNCEYAAINDSSNPGVLAIASIMGMRRVIYSKHGLTSRNPNAITLEFSRGDESKNILKTQRALGGLATIVSMTKLPEVDMGCLDFYRRITEISRKDAEKLGLLHITNDTPFNPLPVEVNQRFGWPPTQTLYSEYWGLKGPWFGGLLIKDGPPETHTASH